MQSPAEIIFQAAGQLDKAGVVSSHADARILLAHAMGLEINQLLVAEQVSETELTKFNELISLRLQGIPVQYITKVAYFRNVKVEVGEGVFIPRPETEVMTGWAIEKIRERLPENRKIVELCTGSGAISKALVNEVQGIELAAVELSASAMEYAKRNLADTSVTLVNANMADCFERFNGKVDLVIANPPYIPLSFKDKLPAEVVNYDPSEALFGGIDGLDAVKTVAKVAWRLLKINGLVCCEHDENQSDEVKQLFQSQGFNNVVDKNDLTGRPRFITGIKIMRQDKNE